MDIFQLFGKIVINNENAKDNINEVTRLAGEAKTKISTGFGNIGNAAVTMGKIVGGVLVGGGAIGGALVSLTDSTMEYRTAMGKLETAFTTSGHSAEAANETYTALASVLGDTDVAVEASNHLAKLTNNQQDLQTWTNICTGVFATFGDSLPIEGLTEAANETAKVGQVTGVLADALNWAGVSEEEFNTSLSACATEQERQQLIMETLNGVYDEASKKYQEVNADVIASNEAQENFNAAMATFGEVAQPIVNAVRDGLASLLTAFSDLIAGADFSAIESAIDTAFAWLIDTAVPAVEDFFAFLTENEDEVVAVIAAVAAGFLAWNVVSIVQGVIAAIKSWKLATEGMTVAQKLLNLVMNANPIGIVVTLVTALVTAFIVLWNTSDEFRQFFINMWEQIKAFFASVVEWLKQACADIAQFFVNAWVYIQAVWSVVVGFFGSVWDGICAVFAFVGEWFFTMFTTAKEKIEEAWSTVTEFFSNIWASIVGVFSEAVAVGEKIIEDIKQGITNAWAGLTSWFTGLWDSLFGNRSVDVNVNASSSGSGGGGGGSGSPRVGVEMYASGAVLNEPTAFAINPYTGKTMVGGEAGAEAIAPISTLQQYVKAAVQDENTAMLQYLERIIDLLAQFMPDALEAMRTPMVLDANGAAIAMAPAMNSALGKIAIKKGRGR